jgi:hypothetical protein
MNTHNMRRTQYGGCACVLDRVDHYPSFSLSFLKGKLRVVKVRVSNNHASYELCVFGGSIP